MKKTFYTVSLIFLIGTTTFAQKMQWIPFNWEGDSLGGKYFDKVAMTIPVSLDDMPYKMMMQFDLGAMVTVVYGNPLFLNNTVIIDYKRKKFGVL